MEQLFSGAAISRGCDCTIAFSLLSALGRPLIEYSSGLIILDNGLKLKPENARGESQSTENGDLRAAAAHVILAFSQWN